MHKGSGPSLAIADRICSEQSGLVWPSASADAPLATRMILASGFVHRQTVATSAKNAGLSVVVAMAGPSGVRKVARPIHEDSLSRSDFRSTKAWLQVR
jgi:hypothetical protein